MTGAIWISFYVSVAVSVGMLAPLLVWKHPIVASALVVIGPPIVLFFYFHREAYEVRLGLLGLMMNAAGWGFFALLGVLLGMAVRARILS